MFTNQRWVEMQLRCSRNHGRFLQNRIMILVGLLTYLRGRTEESCNQASTCVNRQLIIIHSCLYLFFSLHHCSNHPHNWHMFLENKHFDTSKKMMENFPSSDISGISRFWSKVCSKISGVSHSRWVFQANPGHVIGAPTVIQVSTFLSFVTTGFTLVGG